MSEQFSANGNVELIMKVMMMVMMKGSGIKIHSMRVRVLAHLSSPTFN